MKRLGLVGLLIVVVVVALYARSRSYLDREHVQFQATLWRLKHLDATFNEDLLRVRFSLLGSYDDFNHYLGEMDRLAASLHQPPRFVSSKARVAIEREAETLGARLQERGQLFERFKSRNATQGNSRRYFPVAVDELARRLGETTADRALTALLQDVTRVLLASAATPEALPSEALAEPARLQDWAARHPEHTEAEFVSSLAQHALQLLAGKSDLDAVTRELLALPAAGAIKRLSDLYEEELSTALRRTQQYRTLLYVLGGLLVVVIGYALRAMRAANRGLEARVSERTSQLQAEVEERKRTASALQTSEAFLHSLVENLPVYIFRKDRAGRLTFANKLFCDRFGKTSDQLRGRTVFDFLAPDEAARQHAMDERIMVSGEVYENAAEEMTLKGEQTYAQLIKAPVFDAAGRCTGLQGMFLDVTARKRAEADLEKVNRELLEVSRQAGMAEVATGVLHNVGNVLNSVNVSATLVMDRVRESKAASVPKLGALLKEHAADLGTFLTRDPRGRRIPDYVMTLSGELEEERATMTRELDHLRKNIEHIKDIVAMQQSYARVSGVLETVPVTELVEDALRMNASALVRHGLEVVRDYVDQPIISTERHKVMQVLVNLVRNAKYACDDSGRPDKQVTVRIALGEGRVRIAVIDNGVGIPAENLTRIFAHGFTTRKEGHGFGLHSGALVAKELGGSLTAHSAGAGLGAVFTLELPLQRESSSS